MAWSVAAERILQKIKPGMPKQLEIEIRKEAERRALVDTFGENFPVDAHGRAQEQGIGSDHWLANCEEHMAERHLAAVLRFEGPSAMEAMKQKIARLRANRGRK